MVAPLPLEGSCEVENPDDLDQDHNRHADADEGFHFVFLGCCRRCGLLLAEVGVERFAADAELTRKGCLLLTGCRSPA